MQSPHQECCVTTHRGSEMHKLQTLLSFWRQSSNWDNLGNHSELHNTHVFKFREYYAF